MNALVRFTLAAGIASLGCAPALAATAAPATPPAGAQAAAPAGDAHFVAVGSAAAHLDVFDVLGRHVTSLVAGFVGPGQQTISWSPQIAARGALAAGIYFIRLTIADKTEMTRVVVLN